MAANVGTYLSYGNLVTFDFPRLWEKGFFWRLLIFFIPKRIFLTQPKIDSLFLKGTFSIFLHLPHFLKLIHFKSLVPIHLPHFHSDGDQHTFVPKFSNHNDNDHHSFVPVDSEHSDAHPGLEFIVCCVIFVRFFNFISMHMTFIGWS